jgi:bifunctional enzyme CysN/CysC
LLEYLEDVEPVRPAERQPFRMPIQWVSRPHEDFRGYSGLVARGEVQAGMSVKILPSGRVTRVSRIATFDGDLKSAAVGRSVTLTFADQIDASRGDVVVGIEAEPVMTDRIAATTVLDEQRRAPARTPLSAQAGDDRCHGDSRTGHERFRSRYATAGRRRCAGAKRNRFGHA